MLYTKKVTVFSSPKTSDQVFCVAFSNAKELNEAAGVIQRLFGYIGTQRNIPVSAILSYGEKCEKGYVAIKRLRRAYRNEAIRIYPDVGLPMKEMLAGWLPEDCEEKEDLVSVSGTICFYDTTERTIVTRNPAGNPIEINFLELEKCFLPEEPDSEETVKEMFKSTSDKKYEDLINRAVDLFLPEAVSTEYRLQIEDQLKDIALAEQKFSVSTDAARRFNLKHAIGLKDTSIEVPWTLPNTKPTPFEMYSGYSRGKWPQHDGNVTLLKEAWSFADTLKNILKDFFPSGKFYPLERGIVAVARKLRHQQVVDVLEHASERKDIFPEVLIQHRKNHPPVANESEQCKDKTYDLYYVMNALEGVITMLILPAGNYGSDKDAIGNCCPDYIFDEDGKLIDPFDSKE